MPAPKSERLLNLLIMLLVQRRPIAKEQIRKVLYPGSRPDAFEKMFERDKEELRSLGVPIEVGSIDPLFDDEPGYRISPDQFALPDVRLALITTEPAERLAPVLKERLDGHWRAGVTGGTGVLMQGGLHPDFNIEWYEELLSTLHANNANQALERITTFFPAARQQRRQARNVDLGAQPVNRGAAATRPQRWNVTRRVRLAPAPRRKVVWARTRWAPRLKRRGSMRTLKLPRASGRVTVLKRRPSMVTERA